MERHILERISPGKELSHMLVSCPKVELNLLAPGCVILDMHVRFGIMNTDMFSYAVNTLQMMQNSL